MKKKKVGFHPHSKLWGFRLKFITIRTTFRTIALQSPPVAKYAPIGPGSVQGAFTDTLDTSPAAVQMYATIAHTNGLIINGIINVGFNTIGAPKIIGSLILKHAGRNAVLPRFLAYMQILI